MSERYQIVGEAILDTHGSSDTSQHEFMLLGDACARLNQLEESAITPKIVQAVKPQKTIEERIIEMQDELRTLGGTLLQVRHDDDAHKVIAVVLALGTIDALDDFDTAVYPAVMDEDAGDGGYRYLLSAKKD